jgi:hypothetical protein
MGGPRLGQEQRACLVSRSSKEQLVRARAVDQREVGLAALLLQLRLLRTFQTKGGQATRSSSAGGREHVRSRQLGTIGAAGFSPRRSPASLRRDGMIPVIPTITAIMVSKRDFWVATKSTRAMARAITNGRWK